MRTIALVIPVYNEAGQLQELVDHITHLQGFDEAVFIDASDTLKSQQEFQRITERFEGQSAFRFESVARPERASQMNHGANISGSEVLLFLHCDTRLPGQAAQLINQCLQQGFRWGRFDVRLDSDKSSLKLVAFMINQRSRWRRLATGDQAIFIERKLFEEIGGYTRMAIMEDIDFSAKLKSYPPALIADPVITSARRWIQHGVWRTVFKMWCMRFAFWLGVEPDRLNRWYRNAR